MNKKILVISFIQISILIACVFYLSGKVDFIHFLKSISGFNKAYILCAFLFMLLNFYLLGARLKYILHENITLKESIKASVFGMGINNILPAKMGELAKVSYIHKVSSVDLPTTLSGVFWERLMDLNILLGLTLIAASLVKAPAVSALVILVFCIWFFIYVSALKPKVNQKLVSIIPTEKLKQFVLNILEQISMLIHEKKLKTLIALTLAAWLQYFVQIIAIIYFIGEIQLELHQYIIVFAVVVTGLAAPSTPGAVGVFESVMILALGWFGVPAEKAFAVAILAHAVQFIPSVLFALYIMIVAPINFKNQTLTQ